MQRAPFSLPTLIFALALGLLPFATSMAADDHVAPAEATAKGATSPSEPSSPPSGDSADAGASPWEHGLWHNATTMMRIYVCDHARRPPSWCGEPRPLPASIPLPEVQGPQLMEEDAKWLAFLETANPAKLSSEDVAIIKRRAVERRDPQAMEILGFIYADGTSVPRDYVEAYRWYGLAYLAGEQRVRPNMEVVWRQLQRHDLEGALALTREFNSLSRGEVPAGLQPIPATPVPGAGAPPESPAAASPSASTQ